MCTDQTLSVLKGEALFGLVEGAVGALGREPLGGQVTDRALRERLERLHRLETAVAAQKLRCVAEIDARKSYRSDGARSTADLLAQRLHLTPGQARAQTQTAVTLSSLPQTAEAVRSGDVGIEQAQVAVRAARRLRPGPEARAELDRLAASEGAALNRQQLRQRLDDWAHTLDPDALAERERRAWENRRVSITTDTPDGTVRGTFRLDPVGGATLIAALNAKAHKASAEDQRDYGQRLADGLVELAQAALDGGGLPQTAAARPHLIVIAHAETLDDEPGAPAAHLDGIGPISSTTAGLLDCDAESTTVYLTRNHEVLDVGRTRREPTRAQRIAVIARDQGCVGCGAPVSRCQVHHIKWWLRDRGPTDEPNLCLLCWGCHRKVHMGGWDVVRDTTGRYRMAPFEEVRRWRTAA